MNINYLVYLKTCWCCHYTHKMQKGGKKPEIITITVSGAAIIMIKVWKCFTEKVNLESALSNKTSHSSEMLDISLKFMEMKHEAAKII